MHRAQVTMLLLMLVSAMSCGRPVHARQATAASGRATTAPASQAPASSAPPGSPRSAAAPAKRGPALHRVLDRAQGPDDGIHDACLALHEDGDASSVPHLIRALRFFPDEEIEGRPDRGIACTQAHCVAALTHLTGASVGGSYSSWKPWWDADHPQDPLEKPAAPPLQPTSSRGAADRPDIR